MKNETCRGRDKFCPRMCAWKSCWSQGEQQAKRQGKNPGSLQLLTGNGNLSLRSLQRAEIGNIRRLAWIREDCSCLYLSGNFIKSNKGGSTSSWKKTPYNWCRVLVMSFELFESLGLSSKLCPAATRANYFLRFYCYFYIITCLQ